MVHVRSIFALVERNETLPEIPMKPRLNDAKSAPGLYEAMDALDTYLAACGLDETSIAARLTPGGYRPAQAGA